MINQIRLIEIELHSFCNRKCSWCPNSYMDRSFKEDLPEDVFLKLIDELAGHKYSNYISFSRYNEPMSNQELLHKRVQQIRARLPNVTLVLNTNGDYIFSKDYLDIDEITVMDYDNPEKHDSLSKDGTIRHMSLGKISNRGGSLDIKSEKRSNPCYEPRFFVGIDYDGSVLPCCNIRHDIEKHKPYILGNIRDNTLEFILNNTKAKMFRKMTGKGDLYLPEPCRFCNKEEGRYTRATPGIDK